jgi:dolichol-phosphate mannosyltransferase
VLFFSASSCKLPTYVLPAVPLLGLVAATAVGALLSSTRARLPLERLAHQLPAWATAAALLVGTGLAIADLALQPNQGREQVWNWAVMAMTAVYFCYLLAPRHRPAVKTARWIGAATASVLIMMFAFQKFVPQFAAHRSVHANAARLQINAEGHVLPVAYLDWQVDGQSFYFSQPGAVHFTEQNLDALVQYVEQHDEVVFVADPDGAEQLRERLGDAATFTRMPGARGRLYRVSTTPSRTALAHAADIRARR